MSTPISIPTPNYASSPARFFIGREDEITLIVDLLKGKPADPIPGKICVIHGYQGTGKTGLCRAVANQLRAEFSDAHIYVKVDENDPDDVAVYKILEIIIHIFDPFAQISDDLKILYNHYCSVLDGKKVLIILDDLHYKDNFDLLAAPPSCALLITTRVEMDAPNAYSITLAKLSQENSEQFLIKYFPRIDKYAAPLSNICQNLPINLSLVAGFLKHNSEIKIDRFIVELEKHIQAPSEQEAGITELLLDHIFEQLNPSARKLFSRLGLLDGFDTELVAEIADIESKDNPGRETVQAYLDTFTQLNLLAYDEEKKYYRMQPTIQRYALRGLNNAGEVWYRLGEAYTAFVDWTISLANKGADGYLLSLLLFDEHKTTIKKILQYLLRNSSGERDKIISGFYSLISLFGCIRFAPGIELIPLLEAELDASLHLGDVDKLAAILGDLSITYHQLGETKKALDYSRSKEEIVQNRQSDNINSILESFRTARSADRPISDPENKTSSGMRKINSEEYSIDKKNIILTGFMGTGKTTVGKLLADHLNYRFIDTDDLIESRNARSISEIFKDLGEAAFRKMEKDIVKEIAELDGAVISTGGRLMLDPENVKMLSRNGRVFCLVATPDEILTRVTSDESHKRPLLSVPNPKERIVELLHERNDGYLRFPQIVTDEKKPTDIASGLVEFISTTPRTIVIENPQKSYEYIVGAGLLPFIRQLADIEGEIVFITDELVKTLYGPSCASIGQIIEIPSGRQNKSLATVQLVYDQLLEKGFDRTGTIISLGGSIVGDIAGYVAATYMRGVDFVQCPTSLMSMVDTSVGGKTSIDLPQGKNIIGVYKQPKKVIADVATLQTLQQSDLASGMAEVVKHGLIAESNLLEQIEQAHWVNIWDRSQSNVGELQRLVAQAIQVKINIVQADPFEQGRRSILNLGHTFAYAIEQVSNNSYRHGEAVSIGLVAAANLSVRLGYCEFSLQERIEAILKSVNLPTRIPQHFRPDALLQAMQRDKKKKTGQLRFILIRGIGQVFVSEDVSTTAILDTLSALSK